MAQVPSGPTPHNLPASYQVSGNTNDNAAYGNPSGKTQSQPVPGNSKHRTPELVLKFKALSLKSKLLWNKVREDNNDRREAARIYRIENPDFDSDVSENESIYSINSQALEPLCEQEVYPIYADVMPNSVKLRIARLKRKRPQHDLAPDAPPPSRRCMDGNILKAKNSDYSVIQIPQVYFSTEDNGGFIPLPLFHPDVIRYVASNLATIGLKTLTRIDPRRGDHTARTILDIKKLTERFGCELDPSFTYDRYLESVNYYLSFQTSRDPFKDSVSGAGSGKWSTCWFNHFGFFSSCEDAGSLYPFWKHHELELRMAILVDNIPFKASSYKGHFLAAKLLAENDATTRSLLFTVKSSSPSFSAPSNSSEPFLRQEKRSRKSGKKATAKVGQRGGHCLGCAKDHSIFQHLSDNHPDFFPNGKPIHCRVSKGTLLLPDGHEPCFTFNLGSFRKRPCDPKCSRAHACTFCGGPHPALSWTCRRRYPN